MRYLTVLFLIILNFACQKEISVPTSEFEYNKNKWESLGVNSYKYTFQISCFCIPDVTLPKVIEVIDGEIMSVNEISYDDELHWGILSIAQLFDVIEKAEKNNVAVLDVKYHQEQGYPISVYIDRDKMIADEEMDYSVTSLSY